MLSPDEIQQLAALIKRLHITGRAHSFVVINNNCSNHVVKAGREMMVILQDPAAPVQLLAQPPADA